ncbi:MAG: hypothetical protein Q9M11_03635 [Mariprofundaceae bacterium]|nr:hypothetical protein [Mariprofundaceae bacterium]
MIKLQPTLETDLSVYATLIDASLSTESMGVVRGIPEFFINRLSDVISFFGTTNTDLKTYSTKSLNVYYKELHKKRYVLLKAKDTIEYSDIKRRVVPVTTGIDTDLLTAARVLGESNAVLAANIDGVLNDTNVMIAKLVSDKEFRQSSRPVVMDKKYLAANDRLRTGLAKILNPKNIQDTRTVATLLPSLPHLSEAVEIVMSYSGKGNIDTYEGIKSKVAVIAAYSESLYDTFKTEKNAIKKQRILEVSEYLQVSADFVTQAVNTMYMSTQLAIILSNAIDVVTSVE